MVSSQVEKTYSKRSLNQKGGMKAESRTCNVCSAPCSSCMHLNIAHTGFKTEEVSDETCRATEASQYSVNTGEIKSRAYEILQQTGSAAIFLSVNSSHDSFSENAESKATMRSSDTSEDVELPLKLSSGKTGAVDQTSPQSEHILELENISVEHGCSKGEEGHDDNTSCVSRASGANVLTSYIRKDGENILELSENCSKVVDANGSSPYTHSPKSHSERDSHLIGGCSEVSTKVSPKLEVDTDKDGAEPIDEDLKGAQQVEKSNDLDELPQMQEPPLLAESQNESDESDIVEHDVKVCDICGDAGREDLLAMCSRCSDGAEHAYCMREMLQKVPEGDWLCEECKFTVESERQGQDAEEKIPSKISSLTQSCGKRRAERVECASSAKRLATEASFGSPRSSNPTRVATLSRESSFKNLDNGKTRLAHFAIQGGNETTESARASTMGSRLQTPKHDTSSLRTGTLTKSNSFSSSNSRPKVKLVDEVFPQKMIGTRELSSKVGPTRVLAKSMSFKSPNSCFSTSSVSKSKILPSKYSLVLDLKGLKSIKERNPLERKPLSKLDRSMTFSAMTTSTAAAFMADQKITPRGKTKSLSHTSNNRGPKVKQFDGKSSTLTRSNINAGKGVDLPVTSIGASSADGVNTYDEPSSTSAWNADMQDGVTRSLDSVNQGERTKDLSISRSEMSISIGLKGASCQKSEEISHAADSLPTSCTDVSAVRISRDETKKNNDLKAAIEAAIQKVPGKFAKNKPLDRSNGSSVPGLELNCEKTSQDRPVLNKSKTAVPGEGTYEAQVNPQCYASDSRRQPMINNAKQLNVIATDCFRVRDSDPTVFSVGKPLARDWPSYGLAVSSPIPKPEYIWQGTFEVHRAEKLDLCDGVQAHLSTGASPKVLEVVNKFSYKMPLVEVPRLSSWPMQFQSSGAKEDNIALYFFAKDIESYEKNYKVLLDNMIKSDLALKANFDGIELLIFPSNLLPESCQRWNMLYFLWGVCKAKRVESTSVTTNGDCTNKVSLLEQTTLGLKGNSERDDNVPDAKLLPSTAPGNEQICSIPLVKVGLPESEKRVDVNPFIESTGTSSGSDRADKRHMHVGVPVARGNSLPLKHAPIVSHEENSFTNIGGFSDLDVAKSPSKRPCLDLTETSAQTSSGFTPKIPLNDLNCAFVDEDSVSKKLKTDFSEDIGCSSSVDCKLKGKVCYEIVFPNDSRNAERFFFPVKARDSQLDWKRRLSEGSEHFQDGIPNLELGLRAETEPPQDKTVDEKELSLSLSFPSSDKEQNMKPVAETQQILPERQPSVFLFGNILKK